MLHYTQEVNIRLREPQHPMQLSTWKGSGTTASIVAKEIERRWGTEKMKTYNPSTNCFTFNHWKAIGFKVKKGEKAIRSYTFVGKEDEEGNVSKKYCKSVCLFFVEQVEKVNA